MTLIEATGIYAAGFYWYLCRWFLLVFMPLVFTGIYAAGFYWYLCRWFLLVFMPLVFTGIYAAGFYWYNTIYENFVT